MKTDKFSEENIVNTLAESFKHELINDTDQKLIDFVFSKDINQEKLDNFLKTWDLMSADNARILMFAYFLKSHPELKLSVEQDFKIKQTFNTFKLQNIKLISHYKRICNELSKENIEVMIFKGGLMKHLRQELPRVMGDIDIIVKEENYDKSGHIAEKMGYDCSWDIHSVDIHPKGSEEGIMDIHKYVYMNTGKETNLNTGLFARAREEKVFGVQTLIPSNEDLIFITLVNLVRNLRNKTSWSGILFTLYDVQFLINSKQGFDWNIVVENARKTKTETQVYFAIEFLNKIIPNLLPQKIELDNKLQKELSNYCTLLMYQRFFLWDMKQRSHALKFSSIFGNFENFKEYLALKPKYFFLKLPIFKKNPPLARWMLEKL